MFLEDSALTSEKKEVNQLPQAEYYLPFQQAQAEFVERKSRFIGHIKPVSSEAEALLFLKEIQKQHREAAHNVYAYRVYNGGFCRHSDDGEPSGTAGMPLLEVMNRHKLQDFCVVATRYFGGILLGAGGLIRAYANTGSIALEAAGLAQRRAFALGKLVCEYAQFESIKRLLEQQEVALEDTAFTDCVTLRVSLLQDGWETLNAALIEMTAGSVLLEPHGTVYRPEFVVP